MRRFYALLFLLVMVLFLGVAGESAPVVYYRLVYLIVSLLAVSVLWSYLNVRRVQISVERPHGYLKVGDVLESTITIHNPTLLPKLMLEVTDLTEIPGHKTSTVVSIKPYGTVTWTSKAILRKRGTYPLGNLTVTSVDPFGIFRRNVVFPSTEEVIIYPTIAQLSGFYLPEKELRGSVTRRLPSAEVTTVSTSVREYMPGDVLKNIHWPATAHKGHLMSRQFDREVENQVWLLLDLERDVQAGDELDNTEEMVVSIAASLVARFLQEGWSVGLAAQGEGWYYSPARENTKLEKYLDILAQVRALGTIPVELLLQDSPNFLPPGAFVLEVITPSLRPQWVDSLAASNKRGTVVNAVFVDATSYGAPGSPIAVQDRLQTQGVGAYMVRRGEDLSSSLDYRALVPETAQLGGRTWTIP